MTCPRTPATTARMIRHLALALFAAGPAAAHPHMFVTATVEVRIDDDGLLLGVGVIWAYDEFFSLLVTEELGIDPDGDLVLTPAETEALRVYLEWPADFEGDMYLSSNDTPLPLAPLAEHEVSFTDAVVQEAFYRPLATPQDTVFAPVDVRIYDPFYYVAYEIVPAVVVTGRGGCVATLVKPDLLAANKLVDELLPGRAASDVGPDEQFPEVGLAFSDTIRVACGG